MRGAICAAFCTGTKDMLKGMQSGTAEEMVCKGQHTAVLGRTPQPSAALKSIEDKPCHKPSGLLVVKAFARTRDLSEPCSHRCVLAINNS